MSYCMLVTDGTAHVHTGTVDAAGASLCGAVQDDHTLDPEDWIAALKRADQCEACLHLSGTYAWPDGTLHQPDGSCCGLSLAA